MSLRFASRHLTLRVRHPITTSRPWRPIRRTMATSNNNKYDVVIIGGGVSGTALACSLAANPALQDYRVALVEAMDLSNTRNWTPSPDAYSNRVVSLTPASMRFLEKIGVAEHLDTNRVHPYREMHVWDGVTDARIDFDTRLLHGITADKDAIATMVENTHLQHAMLKRLTHSNVDIFEKARVASIQKGVWPTVQLENGEELEARLLVGADGINSPVRQFANIQSLGWDYDMQGVVATFEIASRPNDASYQRFLPSGPIAMLPLGDRFASIVWSIPPSKAALLKKMPAQDFCTLVNSAFRLDLPDLNYLFSQIDPATGETRCDFGAEYTWRQDVAQHGLTHRERDAHEARFPPFLEAVDANSRASFPLRMRNSQHYYDDRVVLVGDAAHTVHPLAGQGLNQGLLDVECLSNLIGRGAGEGQDIGNVHLLREYASARYVRNIAMLSACDKLHKLYSTDFAPITWVRSLGLSAVNQLDFVKAEIMKYAMGIEYTDSTDVATLHNDATATV
ncbi:hypothetical protein BCR43DRAFT_449767 [Syncephalastrum racemosum]|uniref:Ubiquinone biosynthesis monooxygenase COQ6, mitochondrial n=1 Tax=Syncephalastrum racemosum TaxID=13706 RepID=A0A1X2HT73_SYNRA|nr:hypothetical protein BCR43DRAFT_449767 [Syncephalastrum racemosum]